MYAKSYLEARDGIELDPPLLLVVKEVALVYHRLHERQAKAGLVHVLAPVLLNGRVRLPQVVATTKRPKAEGAATDQPWQKSEPQRHSWRIGGTKQS